MDEIIRQIFLIPMLLIATIVNVRDNPQRVFKESNIQVASPSGVWKKAADLPTQRYDFGASVFDDKFYIVGGLVLSTPWTPTNRVEGYDPITNTWNRIADYPRLIHHPGVTSCDNKLYVVGGYWLRVEPLQYVYAYDSVSDTWDRRADLPIARGALAVTCISGKIYALGGESGKKQFSALHVYDTKKDVWETKAEMPTAREHLSVVAVNEKLYALGGLVTNRFHPLATNEMYDPVTNSWTSRSPLPQPLSGFSAVAFGTSIYIFGGASGDGVSREVFEYKTIENTWERKVDMPIGRYGLVAGVIRGEIHVVGGNTVVKGNYFNQDHDVFVP